VFWFRLKPSSGRS